MSITLTRKRLSTVEGQLGIVGAMDMEKMLNPHLEIKLEGSPSLRVLLVDLIDKYPYSDHLFRIMLQVRMHRYYDATVRKNWMSSHLSRVRDPKIIADWCNEYCYDVDKALPVVDKELMEQAYQYMSYRALESLMRDYTVIDPLWKYFSIRALAVFLRHKDLTPSDAGRFGSLLIRMCDTHKCKQYIPAITFMVNSHIKRMIAECGSRDYDVLMRECYMFMNVTRTCDGFSVKLFDHKTVTAQKLFENNNNEKR